MEKRKGWTEAEEDSIDVRPKNRNRRAVRAIGLGEAGGVEIGRPGSAEGLHCADEEKGPVGGREDRLGEMCTCEDN
jgi:hypothetical protein